MEPKPLPPIKWIRECLEYNPATGDLTWKDRPSLSNRVKPGAIAGCIDRQKGYRKVSVLGSKFWAHRLAWALHYDIDPFTYGKNRQIDHINGDKQDNRIENLRIVTNLENQRNTTLPSNSTSGHIGVQWNKAQGKWLARIKVNGKVKHLGSFDDIDKAVSARKAAEKRFGFHSNHGRPAVQAVTA